MRFVLILTLLSILFLGCQSNLTPQASITEELVLEENPITPELSATAEVLGIDEQSSAPTLPPQFTPSLTSQMPYPPPVQATPVGTIPAAYPPPGQPTPDFVNSTTQAYPPPGQATSITATPNSPAYPPPGTQPTLPPTSTQPESAPSVATSTTTIALPTLAPTEFVPGPAGGGAGGQGLVTIWSPWNGEQSAAFMEVVYTFQRSYPGVLVEVQFIPGDDLLAQYEYAAYYGKGPSLLLGSSDWGNYLFDRELVEDLSPYISEVFRQSVTSSALGTGVYRGAQVSLPLAMRGTVLYRNRQIIPQAAQTFEELLAAASAIEQVGVAGGLMEIGPFYSAAHLEGLGGRWMDENGQPAFNEDNFRNALEWAALLQSFSKLGGIEVDGNQDLRLFQEGKIGYLLEASWKRNSLAEAIGVENLAIDPWPAYKSGHLSGYVQAQSIYLNSNAHNFSPENHFYSLVFIGVMMTPEVQNYLAEVGLTPSLIQARPRDALTLQAMQAMAGGTAYPAQLQGSQQVIYWSAIEGLLSDLFKGGVDPLLALESAYQTILDRLAESQAENP